MQVELEPWEYKMIMDMDYAFRKASSILRGERREDQTVDNVVSKHDTKGLHDLVKRAGVR